MGPEKGAVIEVRVMPRASRNGIVGREAGVFKVKLTSPALEGKANKALIGLLSKKLGVPKRDVEILAGERSRTKRILIHGMPGPQAEALLKGGN